MKTKIFAGNEYKVQAMIDEFWEAHPNAEFVAQSQSECYIACDESRSLTVCLTVRETHKANQ